MPVTKRCSRCQGEMEIPTPLPASVRCALCGAVMNTNQSQRGRLLLLGLLSGVLVLGCLGVLSIGALYWHLDDDKEPVPLPAAKQIETAATVEPVPVKPAPPPDPRIAVVRPAVDKGVAYLKANVPKLKGMRCGYVGLNGLALLESGVDPNDPSILAIADMIRASAHNMRMIYDLSASLFFLNRWHELRPLDPKDQIMARSLALRIIAGQLKTGIWGYYGQILTVEQENKLVAALENGTYKPSQAALASMSNAQFAMLAIWGARKHGVPVREPLLALAAYVHANQHADGHWNYPGHSLTATSTCAGLIALALETALLKDEEFAHNRRAPEAAKKRADVNKAFEFLAKTIGRKKGDPGAPRQYGGALFNADAMGDLYFLWTLERVGVIYSKDLIGGKDWFDWGFPVVLKAQEADGSWDEKHGHRFGKQIDTPFAILFLQRSNIARDLTTMVRRHRTN